MRVIYEQPDGGCIRNQFTQNLLTALILIGREHAHSCSIAARSIEAADET
jgi:hypothetical protein